jgi:membrane fusion protein
MSITEKTEVNLGLGKGLMLMVVLILFFCIYVLFFIKISSRELVTGVIVSDTAVSYISSPFDGYIDASSASLGKTVNEGDRLYTIRRFRHSTTSGVGGPDVKANYASRIALLDARLQTQREVFGSERNSLLVQTRAFETELFFIDSQIALAKKQGELASGAFERFKKLLDNEFISPALLEDKEKEVVESKLKLEDLRRSRARLASQLEDYNIRLQTLSKKLIQATQEHEIERKSLESLRDDFDLNYIAAITSPTSGFLDSEALRVGDEVKKGQRLVAVRPHSEVFLIELDIPSSSIGFLKVGQRVQVRYDSFPYLRYGTGEGQIDFVGSAVLENPINSKQEGKQLYRAVVKANLPVSLSKTNDVKLRDRMSVQAEILVSEKSIFNWLFDPLSSASRFVTGSVLP